MKKMIHNRDGKDISVLVENEKGNSGLAIILHGLGGYKEQPQFQVITEALISHDYCVLRLDTGNSMGESYGEIEEATPEQSYEDLEDVIAWARSQEWFQEPFMLLGHSLGAMNITLYAENNPAEIRALVPFAPVVSGESYYLTLTPEHREEWERLGYYLRSSSSKPGVVKKISWDFVKRLRTFSLYEKIEALTMPILCIVGEKDDTTPSPFLKEFYEKLPSTSKRFEIIKGAIHTFREEEGLNALKVVMDSWLDSLSS
jgi:pimeloyl-ACP methyl ester carboxylesterase